MERVFLRRRIGALFCIVGILTILSVFAFYFLEPTADVLEMSNAKCVLIIDPGHGGEDGGAVAEDGTQEADLNLAIALRLRDLTALSGLDAVMTRSDARIDYPPEADTIAARKTADQRQRVKLIRAVPNGVLISIHQNFYPSEEPHGAQVLYAETDSSEVFGTRLHTMLVQSLDQENRRVAAPISKDIYLMRNVQCPAVLVECGFLSNPQELRRLQDPGYETKLSLIMLSSYLQTFQTGWNQ